MVSKNVPDIIYVHVKEFIIDLCNQEDHFDAEKLNLVYAHPIPAAPQS